MSALADHLWQSTWFAAAAGLLALVLRHDARLRYWIWFAASLKFLIPFSLLTLLGHEVLVPADEEALLPLVQNFAVPLTTVAISTVSIGDGITRVLIVLWLIGSAALLTRWLCGVIRVQALVRNSTPCDVVAPVPVRCTSELSEPGVIGIFSPVLLMPQTLNRALTAAEIDCIVAHELWHVRRRDNLTAAIHTLIEALFWFHPLVWWIGARLLDAREHACDEGALGEGLQPHTYAQALLRVCRHSVESRDPCIANAVGGDLKARVRSIMSATPRRFRLMKRTVAIGVFAASATLPVIAGVTVIHVPKPQVAAGSHTIVRSSGVGPSFVTGAADYVLARNVSLRQLISHAYGVDEHDVKTDLKWLDYPRYDVELRARATGAIGHQELVAQLLKQQFNVELVAWPRVRAKPMSAGLDF